MFKTTGEAKVESVYPFIWATQVHVDTEKDSAKGYGLFFELFLFEIVGRFRRKLWKCADGLWKRFWSYKVD